MTDIAAIRERHRESAEEGPVCVTCFEPWPCDADRLLALLADTPSVEPPRERMRLLGEAALADDPPWAEAMLAKIDALLPTQASDSPEKP